MSAVTSELSNRRDVRDTASIDDVVLDHLVPPSLCLLFVYPVWLVPVIVRYLAKRRLGGDDITHASRTNANSVRSSESNLLRGSATARTRAHAPLELFRERLLVEERPGVAELAVEAVFELTDALERALDVAVAGEHEERRVCAPGYVVCRHWGRRVGVEFLLRDIWRALDGGPPSEAADRGRLAILLMREAENRMESNLTTWVKREGTYDQRHVPKPQ